MNGFLGGSSMTGGALGPAQREASIAALKGTTEPGKELDILIVGGGVVGTGTALDAVTRGLSVGIVEANDWAAGTSSRSSKLIHGGLRYLEMLDFALVKEALHERGLILSVLAPHLARPVPFLYPLTKPFFERIYVGLGIALYDAMSITAGQHRGVRFAPRPASRTMPSSGPFGTTTARSMTPSTWPTSSGRRPRTAPTR
jgi:glycerol-3-phosphate dehydrogenase